MTIRKNNKGFSLVELLVVITIIAILSVTAYVALGGQTAKARNSKRMQDLDTVQSALEIYFLENVNTYPVALANLVPAQMPEIPVDPANGTSYYYEPGVANKTYQLSAALEDQAGGTNYEAYVIGNGTGLLVAGDSVAGGVCTDDNSCTVDDGDTNCLPYCI
ncbi:type II secretion system GspH family protein [Patescibacteria group bacterium]|nr:type II secretion system GspH family protein [Patescibacteria group bacterium]MBU1683361.1 type II secretion system GspH family protein [Patescibacteria group bacterium]